MTVNRVNDIREQINNLQKQKAHIEYSKTLAPLEEKERLKQKIEEISKEIQEREKELKEIQIKEVELVKKVILVVAASPSDKSSRTSLDLQFNEIKDALEATRNRGIFEIQSCKTTTLFNLRRLLGQIKPEIVHFCGLSAERCGIWVKIDDESDEYHLCSPNGLSSLSFQYSKTIKCIVLNGCYLEEQAKAIAEGIGCVVGIRNGVDIKVANKFTNGFYSCVGNEVEFQNAYQFIRTDLSEEGISGDDLPIFKTANLKNGKEVRRLIIILEAPERQTDDFINDPSFMEKLKAFQGKYSIESIKLGKGSIKIILEGISEASYELISKKIDKEEISEIGGLKVKTYFRSITEYLSYLLLQLDCIVQKHEFLASLDRFGKIGAFLVRAKAFEVQKWLLKSLVHLISNIPAKSIQIKVDRLFPRSYSCILETLSRELAVPNNDEAVIQGLSNLSGSRAVVLVIYNFHWLPPEDLYHLAWFWSTLVDRSRSSENVLSGKSKLFLFLTQDETEELSDSAFQFTTWRESNHRPYSVALTPLIQISLEAIQEWLMMDSVYETLTTRIGKARTDLLIEEDIANWSRYPLDVLNEICWIFQLEGGLPEVSRFWDL